jgi:hypothetical protein
VSKIARIRISTWSLKQCCRLGHGAVDSSVSDAQIVEGGENALAITARLATTCRRSVAGNIGNQIEVLLRNRERQHCRRLRARGRHASRDAPIGIRHLRGGVACEVLGREGGCRHAERRQLSMESNFSGN